MHEYLPKISEARVKSESEKKRRIDVSRRAEKREERDREEREIEKREEIR